MAQERPEQQDVSRHLAERAARDPQFRRRLIDNPRQAVQDELGVDVPEYVEITVLEETASQIYMILPPAGAPGQALADSDLEQAAGGYQGLTTIKDVNTVCIY